MTLEWPVGKDYLLKFYPVCCTMELFHTLDDRTPCYMKRLLSKKNHRSKETREESQYRIYYEQLERSKSLARQLLNSPSHPSEEDAGGLNSIRVGTSTLEKLPTELLLEIGDNLDDVSKICLRSTSSVLRTVIQVDFSRLSKCSKWLLICRFETDYHALMKSYPRRVACAFCKTKTHQECFNPRYSSKDGLGCSALKLMWKEPAERFCILHAINLLRLSEDESDLEDEHELDEPGTWTKKSQLTCMHCGEDVESSDQRSTGCNSCACDVCPRAIQPRYEYSGFVCATRGIRPNGFIERRGELWMKDTFEGVEYESLVELGEGELTYY